MSLEFPMLKPSDQAELTKQKHHDTARQVVLVASDGDIVLDVTFETSIETLRRCRKMTPTANRSGTAAQHVQFKPTVKVAYRVHACALKEHSPFFTNLLSDPRFREQKIIADAHEALIARGVKPSRAEIQDLPFIPLCDSDEATQAVGREAAFEDMLLLLHQKPIKTAKVVMSYALTLSIMADRFACVSAVSHALPKDAKFKWPVTENRPMLDERGRETDVEQILRQKILAAWLLAQPLRLQQATRELLLRGSVLWDAYNEHSPNKTAAWWKLPDGLEEELCFRRKCILNTIASVQRHFLALYASRERQCRLGYDSSSACDAFQLGQFHKFLLFKGLLYLVDYSPASQDSIVDASYLSIDDLIASLKQCPSYQIDKHHTNCGPYLHLKPIMNYVGTMLSSNAVSISLADWKRRRADVSWASRTEGGPSKQAEPRAFAFTRAMAKDERLRYVGIMHADSVARDLFTAEEWDWTPEY